LAEASDYPAGGWVLRLMVDAKLKKLPQGDSIKIVDKIHHFSVFDDILNKYVNSVI
jgi:hypothetical protein